MGIAGDVDQQIAKQPVDEPRARLFAGLRHLRQRNLEFVKRLVPCLVNAWRLAGRTDEQAREEVRERRMALPVEDDALEQIGPAQERALGRPCAAHNDVAAAAGTDATSIA